MDDDLLINRIFKELDSNSERLEKLSKIVHTNAGILSVVTKWIVAIIVFGTITAVGAMYTTINKKEVDIKKVNPPPAIVEKRIRYIGDNIGDNDGI